MAMIAVSTGICSDWIIKMAVGAWRTVIFIRNLRAIFNIGGGGAAIIIQLSVNATLLVGRGIVLLVAGLMLSAHFDAIDEYYMTANADY